MFKGIYPPIIDSLCGMKAAAASFSIHGIGFDLLFKMLL